MTLKVGDKVRPVDLHPRYETGTVVGFNVRGSAVVLPDNGYRYPIGCAEGHPGAGTIPVRDLEKIEEPTPKFKVGDKVRRTNGTTVQTVTAVRPNRYDEQRANNPFLIALDGDQRYRFEQWFEKVEEPAFKVGDRVRYGLNARWTTGTVVGHGNPGFVQVLPDGYRYPLGCADGNPGAGTLSEWSLTEVEPVPFKLERGDKVVNRKTGRKGKVCVGLYGRLWVGDVRGPFREANMVPASALEEYEEHYPGTYDLIKKDAPW